MLVNFLVLLQLPVPIKVNILVPLRKTLLDMRYLPYVQVNLNKSSKTSIKNKCKT